MKKALSNKKGRIIVLIFFALIATFATLIISRIVSSRSTLISTTGKAANNISVQSLLNFINNGEAYTAITDKATGKKFNIHYKEMGKENKKTIVLTAGLGAGISSWILLQPALSLNYRVITYDPRCLYKSGCPIGYDENYEFSAWEDDLKQLLDNLKISHAYLAGWSMGGLVIPSFCTDYPQYCDRVMLLATAPIGPHADLKNFNTEMKCKEGILPPNATWQDMKKIMDINIKYSFNNSFLVNIISQFNQLMSDENYYKGVLQQYRVLEKPDTDSYSSLAKLKVPTLVLHGDSDQLVSHEDVCSTQKDTNGEPCSSYGKTSCNSPRLICDKLTSKKSAVVISDGSHSICMENITKVLLEINKFLITPAFWLRGSCSIFSPGS